MSDLIRLQRELDRTRVQRNKAITEAQHLSESLTATKRANQRLEREVQALRQRLDYYQKKVDEQDKRRQT